MSDFPRSDEQLFEMIKKLVQDERELHEKGIREPGDEQRLANVRVRLDQCWDLLRQRRARREAGDDPNKAQVRPPSIVENYEQ